MTSNITQPVDVMETMSSSLLEWVRVGILPYIVISFNVVTIVLGTILNVTLMVMFKRWKHYKNPGTTFLIQMSIADILACIVCLPLSTTAAITKTWPLPDVVCYIYGIASRWFYHLSFVFLIFCVIERAVLFRNSETHSRTFGKGKFVACVCLVIYIETFAMSSLPLLPVVETGTITYDPNIFQCGVVQGSNHFIFNLDFIGSIVASVVTYFICSILIFKARRSSAVMRTCSEVNLEMTPQSEAVDLETAMIVEDRGDTSRTSMVTASSRSPSPPIMVSVEETSQGGPMTSRLQKLMSTGQMVVDVMKDNKNDEAYHLTITYLLTWSMVAIFWSVQPLLTYIEVYGRIPIWGGAHIIAIMIGGLSYCVKPIVYLSHNRNLQRQTKSVLPKVVQHTATKVKVKLSTTVDMIDRAVFDPHIPRRARYPRTGRTGSADSTRRLDLTGGVSRSSTELSDEVLNEKHQFQSSHRVTFGNDDPPVRVKANGVENTDVDR